jgi:hypothetical protein
LHTLPDKQFDAVFDFVGNDDSLLGIRAKVEKPEVESVDVVSRFVESLELSRSDRALEIVVEDSTRYRHSCEGCSYCHGVRRGDPFCRAKNRRLALGRVRLLTNSKVMSPAKCHMPNAVVCRRETDWGPWECVRKSRAS